MNNISLFLNPSKKGTPATVFAGFLQSASKQLLKPPQHFSQFDIFSNPYGQQCDFALVLETIQRKVLQ